MNNPIKEELQRLSDRFLVYGRTILIAIFMTAIFLSFYAGLQANNFTVQIITVLICTLSVALVGLFSYFALRIQRDSNRIHDKRGSALNEDLIRQLILDVQELTPNPKQAVSTQSESQSVEGGLFRLTFLLAYRVAFVFYSALQLLRLTSPDLKQKRRLS
jgi:hypothetical protein